MDVLKVYNATRQALDRIRRGGGPQFIECETYRYRGHSMADPGTYRPAVELKAYQNWIDRSGDPRGRIPVPDARRTGGNRAGQHPAVRRPLDHGEHLAEAEVEELKHDVQKIVDDAVAFALQSAQPTMDAAWGHLNVNRHHEVLM